jgi:hypothetical protein
MITKTRLTVATLFLAASATTAMTQPTSDHSQHHPGAPATMMPRPPSTDAVPMMDMSKMMSGDMSPMMRMRRGMMMGDGNRMAMMPFEHIEGRIAFIKAELGITDAQLPQWTVFAESLRTSAKTMRDAVGKSLTEDLPATAPQNAAAAVQMMTIRLEAMKTTASAIKVLYDGLTADQRKVFDDVMSGPMGGL